MTSAGAMGTGSLAFALDDVRDPIGRPVEELVRDVVGLGVGRSG